MKQYDYETCDIYNLKSEYDSLSRKDISKDNEESLRSLRSLMIKSKRMNSIFEECSFTKEFVRNYLDDYLPTDVLSDLTIGSMRDVTIEETKIYSYSHSHILNSLRLLKSTWSHIGWVCYDERHHKTAEELEKLFEDTEKEKERLLDLFYDEYTNISLFCKELLIKKSQ